VRKRERERARELTRALGRQRDGEFKLLEFSEGLQKVLGELRTELENSPAEKGTLKARAGVGLR